MGPGKRYSGVDGVPKLSLGTCTLTITIGEGIESYTTDEEFIVIPTGSAPNAPLSVLLGTPFMSTARAIIDVGQMELHVYMSKHKRLIFPLDVETDGYHNTVQVVLPHSLLEEEGPPEG
jgi:hypothetical protein